MSDTIRACLWMLGAIVSFTSMAIAGRAVSSDLDTFEIMLFRSLIGIFLVLCTASVAGTLRDIRMRKLGWHGLRNMSHFAGQNLWFFAITVVPLAQVFALEFTMPIWAILLSAVFLGERLTTRRLAVAAIGFVGILIVTRPWEYTLSSALIAAGLAAIGFAGSAVFTRRLTRTESVTSILFWLTVMQAILGLGFAGADGDIALPQVSSLPWVLLISCAGLFAHFCLTTALALAPAAVVMPIDFARLPLIMVIGAAFYAEPIEMAVIFGALIIFAANYTNILSESRAEPFAQK